jgi:peptidyl-prolyl cis-trans isomerase SurA
MRSGARIRWMVWLVAALALRAAAQSAPAAAGSGTGSGTVLDSVVAVVNNYAILSSDVEDEVHLAALDPSHRDTDPASPVHALDELISRTLIQERMRQEGLQSATPTEAEVDARLGEIRRELPACLRANCATEQGWNAFLADHHLTAALVERYIRTRIEILSFIEERFRQGIQVTRPEVETYYRQTLLPQYAPGAAIPSLDSVAPRIEEILLQQQVNTLFDDWLRNLRRQGDVEILDPALESAVDATGAGEGSE